MTNFLGTDDLASLATGRGEDLFAADVSVRQDEIVDRVRDRRLLVIGGAGSIGAATIGLLTSFRPAALHVVDQSENGLAELVRDLRSRPAGLPIKDFRTLPLDFGSTIMSRFLAEQEPYDYVLNFAAIKHVRSEKDIYSVLQMFETNVLKQARLLELLAGRQQAKAYFSVSTDKAANPVNLMGASKRLMEHVMFSGEVAPTLEARVTSARFANVAFSEGSLLQSFVRRIEKRQPIAVPRSTQRFFVSLREAGQICLLAAICAPSRCLLIPRLSAECDLRDLESIATAVVKQYGFEPVLLDDDAQARQELEPLIRRMRYPVLRTPLDTTGEKPYEEFVGKGETVSDVGMQSLLGVDYLQAASGTVRPVLDFLTSMAVCQLGSDAKTRLIKQIQTVVPEFSHEETSRHLDARM